MSEEVYDEDRRIHWMIFTATVIGMALLAVFLINLLDVIRANHGQDEITRRERIDACRTVEHEVARTACIGNWGH